jgi:uracil-DNA glycosylase
MSDTNIQIHDSWKAILGSQFSLKYMQKLKQFLVQEKNRGAIVYPPSGLIFNAFNLTPFNEVKVVILGQDPYHNPKQAHGLSFSVADGIKPPPSLVNIFKELQNDFGYPIPNNGNLTVWAQQGVLLLNSILTVRANSPASHRNQGWEKFTDTVISKISEHKSDVVFLLWGAFAKEKAILIDEKKHLILTAPHPSPYSAAKGFFGCKHFSATNEYLIMKNFKPINWQIV